MRIPMRSEEVELSIWGAMGGLLAVVVVFVDCSTVLGADGVRIICFTASGNIYIFMHFIASQNSPK